MGSRGRKPSAALAIPASTQKIETPEAPYDLNDGQTEVWRSLSRSILIEYGKLPVHAYPVLAEICRHVVKSRHIHQLIDKMEKKRDFKIMDYDRLLKMAERESRGVASHSVKLRAILAEGGKVKNTLSVQSLDV